MKDLPLLINSSNRYSGSSSNFLVKFSPPLMLGNETNRYIGLDRFSAILSWYNISDEFDNKTIKYSSDSGSTFHTITFADGSYSYKDINDYIKSALTKAGIDQENNKTRIK